jgi:hypothetical protein
MTTTPADPLIDWMADFDKEVEKLASIFMQFSNQFMAGIDPSTRRRIERDLARLNRRPSLIHNGRRAR